MSVLMLPSGSRTETAQCVAPRIITPSSTACPPMYRGSFLDTMCCLGLLLLLGVATLEALDPATGVNELLLARVERVALRAELDPETRHRRTSRELVAARAVHLALDVVGVDVSLHGVFQSNGGIQGSNKGS